MHFYAGNGSTTDYCDVCRECRVCDLESDLREGCSDDRSDRSEILVPERATCARERQGRADRRPVKAVIEMRQAASVGVDPSNRFPSNNRTS